MERSFYKYSGYSPTSGYQSKYVSTRVQLSIKDISEKYNWEISNITVEKLILITQEEYTALQSDIDKLEEKLNGQTNCYTTGDGNVIVQQIPDDYEQLMKQYKGLIGLKNRAIMKVE